MSGPWDEAVLALVLRRRLEAFERPVTVTEIVDADRTLREAAGIPPAKVSRTTRHRQGAGVRSSTSE